MDSQVHGVLCSFEVYVGFMSSLVQLVWNWETVHIDYRAWLKGKGGRL